MPWCKADSYTQPTGAQILGVKTILIMVRLAISMFFSEEFFEDKVVKGEGEGEMQSEHSLIVR